ncbi:MAG TPA: hypothetical protein VII74_05520 [Chthoniobacterales bacterium]
MIAVTFALPTESSGFRRHFTAQKDAITVFHTGVGEKVCRPRIEAFLGSRHFDFLISSGFAGGIALSLGVGDLLLAENFSDPDLLARAHDLLVARVGKLATAAGVIETAAERNQFAQEHGATAVDMETAWIAEACAQHAVRMLSLRVISDTAAAPFSAPPSILFDLARQKTPVLKLGGYLLRHPAGVVRLSRFAQQIAQARASLTSALLVLAHELRV